MALFRLNYSIGLVGISTLHCVLQVVFV